MATTISTSGIAPGQIIKSEQVLRIIYALSGVNNNVVIISGSLGVTGSAEFRSPVLLYSGATGSLQGTSSWAITASYALNTPDVQNAASSSYPFDVGGTTVYTPFQVGNFNTTNAVLIGDSAGSGSSGANNSNFIGYNAGYQASYAYSSNYLGYQAGYQATVAPYSNFLGYRAGYAATDAYSSNFLGFGAGEQAANASISNFLGYKAGYAAASASYSTLIGYQVGYNVAGGNLGLKSNNIIIGTNITLENGRRDSINLGSLIFGTGSYSTTTGNPFSGSMNGRVGINQPSPIYSLDVSGSGNYTNGLTVTGSLNVTAGVTGSVYGTASYALNAISASYLSGSTAIVDHFTSSYDILVNTILVGRGGIPGVDTNVVVGSGSLLATSGINNYSGSGNTVVGSLSLQSTSIGSSNTAVGYSALQNFTGSFSTAVGAYALRDAPSGRHTAVGQAALLQLTTGSGNTAIGDAAMYYTTGGDFNTAVGFVALRDVERGNQNTVVGAAALYGTFVTGSGNTVVGFLAGQGLKTGSYNTIIGANVGGLSDTLNNNIIVADGQGNIRARYSSSIWTLTDSIKLPGLNSTLQPNIVGYDTVTGQLYYQSANSSSATTASFVTSSDVYGPYGSNSVQSASYALQATTASYVASTGVEGPLGMNSVLSSSYTLTSSIAQSTVGDLTNGTGISNLIFDGSGNATVEVSGAVGLSTNAVTKWTGAAFANSSLTDNGTTISGTTSLQLTGANTSLTGSFTGSFKGDGSQLSGLASILAITASDGTSGSVDLLTQGLVVNGVVNEIEATVSNQTLTVGLPDDVVVGNNLTVTNNLTVFGTASFQNTTNLEVADRFILLASGSNAAGDGGIVVQQGAQDIGEVFAFDSGTTRWAVTSSFNAVSSSFAPDAYMAAVVEGSSGDPALVPGRYVATGNIFIGNDESIWIYS